MKSRAYCLSSQSQICEYCCTCMLGDQFYLFPCSHGFHTNCLLKQAHINLDKSQLSALQGIESSLKALEYRVKDDMRAKQQQDALQMELDGYLAGDCPLCGYVMIRLLGEPLIESEDSEEAKSWEI